MGSGQEPEPTDKEKEETEARQGWEQVISHLSSLESHDAPACCSSCCFLGLLQDIYVQPSCQEAEPEPKEEAIDNARHLLGRNSCGKFLWACSVTPPWRPEELTGLKAGPSTQPLIHIMLETCTCAHLLCF